MYDSVAQCDPYNSDLSVLLYERMFVHLQSFSLSMHMHYDKISKFLTKNTVCNHNNGLSKLLNNIVFELPIALATHLVCMQDSIVHVNEVIIKQL
jgi:hypothetical protein